MAAITGVVTTGTGLTSNWVGGAGSSHYIEKIIDLADAVTSKGSALAQGDTIQVLAVPAGSQVLFAGFQLMTVMTGTSADATLDFGVTGGDVDCWVDGFDLSAGTALAYAAAATASITPAETFYSAADTLDLLIATQTGTITGGTIRVFAHILNCAPRNAFPGIAAIGS